MTEEELKTLYQDMMARGTGPGREPCVAPERLATLAENRASPEDRLRWMAHVASCRACADALALLCLVEEADGGSRTTRRVPAWSLALAASLALLIAGGVFVRERQHQRPVLRGDDAPVSLIGPDGDVTPAAARLLTWHAVPRATRYEIEILDPAGSPVFAAATGDTSIVVPEQTTLAPGREYWWRAIVKVNDGTRSSSPARPFRIITP